MVTVSQLMGMSSDELRQRLVAIEVEVADGEYVSDPIGPSGLDERGFITQLLGSRWDPVLERSRLRGFPSE